MMTTDTVSRRAALSGAVLVGVGMLAAEGSQAWARRIPHDGVRSGTAPIDGLNVYFEVHGGSLAPGIVPVVLFHGGAVPIEVAFPHTLIERLSRNQPVVLIEQQGHGHTADRPDLPMTIERMVSDTVGVLTHLGISKADLVGHSLGGIVATGVSIRRPSLVNSVMTLGAPYQLEGFRADLVRLQKGLTTTPSPELAKLLPTEAEVTRWRESFRRSAPQPDAFDTILQRMNVMLATWPGWTRAELQAIRAPTMIVIGDNDYVRIEHAAEMAKVIPNAHLAVLPATTHLNIIERVDWLELALHVVQGR